MEAKQGPDSEETMAADEAASGGPRGPRGPRGLLADHTLMAESLSC